jgi:hypothetical protein
MTCSKHATTGQMRRLRRATRGNAARPKNYRLIHTAIWRIEQQGIYVAESSSNPAHLAGAEEVLACMVRGRQQLSLRRGKVRLIGPVF